MKLRKVCIFIVLCFSVLSSQIINAQTVTLATVDWPPYIGPGLKNDGYVTEIVDAAFQQVGMQTDIKYMAWARAVLVTKEGEIDGLFPAYYNADRTVTHAYSNPFPGGPLGFMRRFDKEIQYGSLRDLENLRIGVVRGYVNTKEFDEAEFLDKHPVQSDLLNLRKLVRDRLDLVVIDKIAALYMMQQNMPAQQKMIEFVEPPLEVKNLYIAFSRKTPDYEAKLKAFNSGLAAIEANGELDRILAASGF